MARSKTPTRSTLDTRHPLTPREQIFVRAYLCDLNGTRAALKAGFGSTSKSAGVYACRLLAKASIRAAVDQAVAARAKRLELTADNVLREIARVALGDPRRLVDADGQLIAIADLEDDAAAMVSSFEIGRTSERRGRRGPHRTREQVTKIKFWDKTRALELACKHLGIGDDGAAPPQGPSIIFPPGTRIAIE